MVRLPGTLSPANFRYRSAVEVKKREGLNKAIGNVLHRRIVFGKRIKIPVL